MQGLVQYIMDTYTIYCASAIASTVLLRSVLACVFPLICPPMFGKLGDQWALSLFAFMSVACMPLPTLFFVSNYLYRDVTFPKSVNTRRNMALGSEANPSTLGTTVCRCR